MENENRKRADQNVINAYSLLYYIVMNSNDKKMFSYTELYENICKGPYLGFIKAKSSKTKTKTVTKYIHLIQEIETAVLGHTNLIIVNGQGYNKRAVGVYYERKDLSEEMVNYLMDVVSFDGLISKDKKEKIMKSLNTLAGGKSSNLIQLSSEDNLEYSYVDRDALNKNTEKIKNAYKNKHKIQVKFYGVRPTPKYTNLGPKVQIERFDASTEILSPYLIFENKGKFYYVV